MKTCLLSLLAALLAVCCLVGGMEAQDKLREQTLKGNIVCAKCELGLTKKCASVIVVKEAGKDTIYWFDARSNKQYHAEICSESRPGEVTGVVSAADGKNIIAVRTLKFK